MAAQQDESCPQRSGLDPSQVLRHVGFAVVVGLACGLASVLLCICVGWAYGAFLAFPWLVWSLPVLGALQLAAYRLLRLAPNMTTHRVIERMRADEPIPALLAPGILLTTCMSIVGGASVGKEAGALQIGASLGSLVSRPWGIEPVFRKHAHSSMNGYVAGCGMAACFAALFFAPLGSCMFVLELTHFRRTLVHHVPTILLACFVAYLVASLIGIGDVIALVALPALDWRVVGQCVVIGVAAALVGTVFASLIKLVHRATERITTRYWVWAVIGGLAFAVLVTFGHWEGLTGTGGDTLDDALTGRFGPADFLVKALLTLVCLGFWLKGGEIMPSLCIGGLLGASCTFLTGGDAAFGAAIGAMAFFAAFSRCPLAALLMGCEIFGWAAAPFLAIAVLIASLFGYPVGMYGEGAGRIISRRLIAPVVERLR